jgi:hypothetical protein
MRIGLSSVLVAVVVMAGTAPPVLGQLHLPRLRPSKTPPQPNVEAETRSWFREPPRLAVKLSKIDPSQHKVGTEVVGGAFGGGVAGGAFGSFAGPGGTVVGAAGGALAGGVGAAAAGTFKEYARRHWGWR